MLTQKNVILVVSIIFVISFLYSCGPKITDFSPERGIAGTTDVAINGKNFKTDPAGNTVKFGDITATSILETREDKILTRVPLGAKTALISVRTDEGVGYSDKNFIVDTGTRWTFMVYLDADNNLESSGIDDFLEMATVGSSHNINIIVQMDRTGGYDNSYGDWTGTRRFIINRGDTPDKVPLADLDEQNMGDPNTLESFVTWAVQNYPAQHYALSIWNHGNGWREILEKRQARAIGSKRDGSDRHEGGVVLRAVASDDTDGDVLYMKEVQSALESSRNFLEERLNTKVKLDIVGFDACLMGMIEVSYALRNVANYVVASEWVEPGDGWPYDTILSELESTSSFDGKDLGSAIVNKYGLAYGSGITMSSVDISKINDVVSKIDALTIAMNTEWGALKTAHGNTISYHYPPSPLSTWGIDLWQFADKVYNGVTSATIKTAALQLKNSIDDFVVTESHTSDKDGSHGVAIYFPADLTTFNNDPDHTGYMQTNTVYQVDFVIDHRWDEFLQTYYTNTSP
jgi:hypothetical protein